MANKGENKNKGENETKGENEKKNSYFRYGENENKSEKKSAPTRDRITTTGRKRN